MKPMTPSPALAAVVGDSPQPRTEITKRIWDYIKKHKLQNSQNKRMIDADDKLRAVFGGRRQVSMFEMTKLVNNQLR
jgi:chromatin remodeling complex protein RSC6